MGHNLHFSATQISEDAQTILRGYDPLRELYQWYMLSLLLVSELILVGAASIPLYNSELMMIGTGDLIWGIRPGIIVPFLLLLGTLPLLFRYRNYRREKWERAKLRHAALICNTATSASTQLLSFPASQKFPLPMQVESRLKKLITTSSIIGCSLFAASIIINALTLLINSSEIPFLLSMIAMVAGMGITFSLGPGIGRDMRLRIAGHYLHPSLTIDDTAITARYGNSTVTIAWHDIRYFALVSSTTFRGLPSSKTKSPREAFEISDGQNVICWLKTEPLSSHRLSRFGEIALSDEDYAAFTQQFAALIMDRTGLPLYDLRLDRHKK